MESVSIWDYYETLQMLRTQLIEAGLERWAVRLLDAERAGSTAGELLDSTVGVLRQCLASGDLGDRSVRAMVDDAVLQNRTLWDGV